MDWGNLSHGLAKIRMILVVLLKAQLSRDANSEGIENDIY